MTATLKRDIGGFEEKTTYKLSFSDFNPKSLSVSRSENSPYDNTIHLRTTNAQKKIRVAVVVDTGSQLLNQHRSLENELHLTTSTKGDAEKVQKALAYILERCHAETDLF